MNTKDLKIQFDQRLKPLGYQKKGTSWILKTEALTKIIELQKSAHSNSYYINFHINFNQLDSSEKASHVFNRMEQVLSLEDVTDEELRNLINQAQDEIIRVSDQLVTVDDVRGYVKTLPTLNILPLKVKEFLKIN